MAIMKRQAFKSAAIGMAALAVAVSPAVAGAVSDTTTTTINATIEAVISIASNNAPVGDTGQVDLSLTPTSGGVVSSGSDAIEVNTNNATGFELYLANSDTTTSLVNGANNITAHAGTVGTPTTLAANTWGFALATGTPDIVTNAFDASYSAENSNGSSTSKWAGVPSSASPVKLRDTTTTATADITTFWYGVKVNTSLPTGVYTDTVTYTATTN